MRSFSPKKKEGDVLGSQLMCHVICICLSEYIYRSLKRVRSFSPKKREGDFLGSQLMCHVICICLSELTKLVLN